ncbi:MAG: hypothetical protein ACI9KE_005231 [Polyangiales bacterium]|jgi:hypothetical protein
MGVAPHEEHRTSSWRPTCTRVARHSWESQTCFFLHHRRASDESSRGRRRTRATNPDGKRGIGRVGGRALSWRRARRTLTASTHSTNREVGLTRVAFVPGFVFVSARSRARPCRCRCRWCVSRSCSVPPALTLRRPRHSTIVSPVSATKAQTRRRRSCSRAPRLSLGGVTARPLSTVTG